MLLIKNVLKYIVGMLGAINLIILLLTIAIQIPTFSVWFYRYEFSKNGTYDQVKMTESDLIEVTRHMQRYMRGEEDQLNIETYVDGERRFFFSEREVLHMEDVRDLFLIGFNVRAISFFLFIMSSLLFISPVLKKHRRLYLKCIQWTVGAVLAVSALTAIAIAIDFDNAFNVFHEIFFDNDLWLLDWDVDLLLNIVPTPFFVDIAALIGILYAVFLSMIFVCATLCFRLDSIKNRIELR